MIYTECCISPGPYKNSVIWPNTEKYKEGKVVANYMFSNVGMFLPGMNCYGTTLLTLSIAKVIAMLPH
jgi:hypothetical protein